MNLPIPTETRVFSDEYATLADLLNEFARRLLALFAAIKQVYAVFGYVPQFPGLGG